LAVIEAYVNGEGDMDAVFEEVMLSNPLDDEERFKKIIDSEIEEKRVEAYDKYVKETKASRKRRSNAAKKEAAEAMEMARELGVEEKLFGKSPSKKRKNKAAESDTSGLAALIQQRQKSRASDFLADLEAKYAPQKGSKKQKRAAEDEPSEEAFQRTAERMKRNKASADAGERDIASPRKTKRSKR
jgi:DnaJ family protein C protein 9